MRRLMKTGDFGCGQSVSSVSRNIPVPMYLSDLGTRSFFPDSLSAHFISMDRYRSIAHFANFQVRSLLNRSQINQWFPLEKER